MKNTFYILSLTCAFIIVACSTSSKNREIQSEKFSIVTKKYKWSKDKISVCFIDTEKQFQELNQQNLFIPEKNATGLTIIPFNAKFKADIKNAIQTSYHTEDIGIQFVGFNDCDGKMTDVAVVYSNTPDDTSLNVSMIGDPSKAFTTPKINLVRLNSGYFAVDQKIMKDLAEKYKIKSKPMMSIIDNFIQFSQLSGVVHEFGHLAGLHHEHYRLDHAEALRNTDFTFSNYYADSLINGQKLAPPDTSDFQVVSEFDPFSAMNYMRNSNYTAVEIAIKCLNKSYTNFSPADLKHTCDFNYLNRLIKRNPNENYLSEGDIKSLKILYKNAPQGNPKEIANPELYQWVTTTKSIIEKYQLQFPLTRADHVLVTPPAEALYCNFSQAKEDKILRILLNQNRELTNAWYHQSVYENVTSTNYGFEFESIKKNPECSSCYELATSYKGQPFKTLIKLSFKDDEVSLKIEDLNAYLGCFKIDMTHAALVLKDFYEKQKNKGH